MIYKEEYSIEEAMELGAFHEDSMSLEDALAAEAKDEDFRP